MSKTMSLENLSSIKGATSSTSVDSLFEVIKNAESVEDFSIKIAVYKNAVPLESLRNDEVLESSEIERKIIVGNFDKEKNGYLVVSKVIED